MIWICLIRYRYSLSPTFQLYFFRYIQLNRAIDRDLREAKVPRPGILWQARPDLGGSDNFNIDIIRVH